MDAATWLRLSPHLDELLELDPSERDIRLTQIAGDDGPYRLEELLGEGGMGQVWRASRADGLYQRRVALKLLRPGLTDQNLRLRFARERQILARLAHPHIAGLLDAGVSAEGVPYLALEYVEGEPITQYWQRLDVPLDARLRMFRQVCAAVSHAHANLVVHCELLTGAKPYRLKRQSDAEWEEAILTVDPVRPSQRLLREAELKTDRF